jgi:hypothetical protein
MVGGTWTMLGTPNAKQKEAYGRYCHTLSVAGVIGSLTLVFSESPKTGLGDPKAASSGVG